MRTRGIQVGVLSLWVTSQALWFTPAVLPKAHAEEVRAATGQVAELRQKGQFAFEALDFRRALEVYTQAYELSKDASFQYNRAMCLRALGDFPEAMKALNQFMAEASPELRARVPKLDDLVTDIRQKIGALGISSPVPITRLTYRGKLLSWSPGAAPVPFNVGPGELEAWATGYNPIRKPVSIEAGKVTEVRMDFVLAATTGVVRLRSAPEGVNISLQGVDLGAAPLEWEGKPGNYTFEGRRAGYEPGKLTVVVRRGERSDALLTLRREEPITRRWWFWASVGAGVVTVGTVLGVLAYNTERKPDSGTLVPGNVASPLLVF